MCGTVLHKISLFGKMQRGRSPSFELIQLDMYDFDVSNYNSHSLYFSTSEEGRQHKGKYKKMFGKIKSVDHYMNQQQQVHVDPNTHAEIL